MVGPAGAVKTGCIGVNISKVEVGALPAEARLVAFLRHQEAHLRHTRCAKPCHFPLVNGVHEVD